MRPSRARSGAIVGAKGKLVNPVAEPACARGQPGPAPSQTSGGAADDLHVADIEDACSLEALAPDWWTLWRRIPTATPFQSPAWLIPWWRAFGPGRLRTVAVRARGRLVGLAPFYVEEGERTRRLLPLGIPVSDYLDVLVDPEHEGSVGPALLARLLGGDPPSVVCCEELPPDAAALRLWGAGRPNAEPSAQSACPVLDLARAEDGLTSIVPAGRLRILRRARYRTHRRHGRVETATRATTLPFLRELFRLHGTRWTRRGEDGLFADHRVRRFHEEAAPALMDAGLLCLYGLSVDGRQVGAYYGFSRGRRAYAYCGGFDPAFASLSPGMVLIGHAIEEAVRRGATEFHFLRGRETYKYEWGAKDRWNSRLELRNIP
ncbi:MAG: GNAT family N-acetyltransferase [Variibacter sp.]|nr:GNAT family N-acetyltransferase [Variibacter sp.]